MKWFCRAAEQDHELAQLGLGCCYRNGQGVVRNYVEAYKWFLLAAGQGDEDARKNADSLESIMTRDQIAEGQEMAHQFKPREVPSARQPQ